MEIGEEISEFLERLASFAESFKRKIAWLVTAGAVCSTYFAWLVYNQDAALWWNVIKCGLVLLPSLIWLFIWNLLGQMSEAPSLAASLANRPDSMLTNLNTANYKDKIGIAGLFSALRAFRKEEGLEVVMDTIGSVTIIANPLFAAFSAIMMVVLVLMIFLAPVILLF